MFGNFYTQKFRLKLSKTANMNSWYEQLEKSKEVGKFEIKFESDHCGSKVLNEFGKIHWNCKNLSVIEKDNFPTSTRTFQHQSFQLKKKFVNFVR